MPTKHLTDVVCQTISAAKQTRFWDRSMPNFGLTVGPRSKTFMVMAGQSRKLVTLGKYPHMSLAEARREAHRVLGTYTPTATLSFSEARADFVQQHCYRNNRLITAKTTESLLNRVSFSSTLATITRRDIQAAIRDLPPSSANHTLAALKTMFNWCVENGVLTTTPLLRAKMPYKTASRTRVLTDIELTQTWHASSDMGLFGTFLRVLILTGCRRNEVVSIQPEWVRDSTIILPGSFTKNNREHIFPVSPMLGTELSSLPIRAHSFAVYKRRLDEVSKVTGWTFHDLRRTFATIHAKIGTAPHVIEALLNHATGQISGVAAVYNRYQYLDEKRAAMLAFESHVAALISPK